MTIQRTSSNIGTSIVLGALLASGGAYIASRRAPAAAITTPMPSVAAPASSLIQQAKLPTDRSHYEVEEVAIRLTERLNDAAIDMPQMERGLQILSSHWRRLQAPWLGSFLKGERAKMVQNVTIRTSQHEVQYQVTLRSGENHKFDVRQWNLNHGSFSQREAIVAPTPSTIRYKLQVPMGAAFEVAPMVMALAGSGSHDVAFVVRVHSPGGQAPIEIGRTVIGAHERDRWKPSRFDLSAFAGQEVELELGAEALAQKQVTALPTAVALWGTPQIVRKATAPKLPYNVVWFVVDALRPDAIASFHDRVADAQKRSAKKTLGDTLLPEIQGLTPSIDALATRSTIFRNAVSASHLTRAGTLAMLTGMHGAELGLPALPWILQDPIIKAYYSSKPPLISLALRNAGAATRAIVNNNFMLGYSLVGIDMGFEHIDDFRYQLEDTDEITKSAIQALRQSVHQRHFMFINFESPHSPFQPPKECLNRVPKPKEGGPTDEQVRQYMGEVCKDDLAIGKIVAEIDRLGLRERTMIIVTADHGETLAAHHEMVNEGLDHGRTRFQHAFGMFEETTRVPLLISLPGVIPENKKIDHQVTTLDLAPTILKLQGLEAESRQKGADLIALAKGSGPLPTRPILSMGRAMTAIFHDNWRYVKRDPPAQNVTIYGHSSYWAEELYDLKEDPGETTNLARIPAYNQKLEEMRTRLTSAVHGMPNSLSKEANDNIPLNTVIHFRFVSAGRSQAVRATITARNGKTCTAIPIGIEKESIQSLGCQVEAKFLTLADRDVGFDLSVDPPNTSMQWSFVIDQKTLLDESVFGGTLGVSIPGLSRGLSDASLQKSIVARLNPYIDPALDFGVFITREQNLGEEANVVERVQSGAAAAEVQRALKDMGYAK